MRALAIGLRENASGLDRVLEQDTRTRHFIEHDGEPIVSFRPRIWHHPDD